MQTDLDHISVGGGFAGGAVAARLAERPDAMARIKAPQTNAPATMIGWQIGGHGAATAAERTAA